MPLFAPPFDGPTPARGRGAPWRAAITGLCTLALVLTSCSAGSDTLAADPATTAATPSRADDTATTIASATSPKPVAPTTAADTRGTTTSTTPVAATTQATETTEPTATTQTEETTAAASQRETPSEPVVEQRATIIRTLTVSSRTPSLGQDVTVTFDVISGGQPLAGATGIVSVGGVDTRVTLDASGTGSVVLADLAVGSHQIVARYPGDEDHAGASAPITVTVTDPTATPTAPPPPTPATDAVTVAADPPADNQCPPTAHACIDLTHSVTWLQRDGKVTYGPVPMTSGMHGLRTRPGMWHVYWKHKNHVSGYYGTPMPNAIFFDRVGIAFHQGSLTELSHGCIHLSWEASEAYWKYLGVGASVYVWGYAPYAPGDTMQPTA